MREEKKGKCTRAITDQYIALSIVLTERCTPQEAVSIFLVDTSGTNPFPVTLQRMARFVSGRHILEKHTVCGRGRSRYLCVLLI